MKRPIFSDIIKFHSHVYHSNKRPLYMPEVTGLVINGLGLDIGTAETFLFDTGAAVSILSQKYQQLFSYPENDSISIQYGAGSIRILSVYDAFIQIKGTKLPVRFAIDPNIKTGCLIGNIDFMDKFRSITLGYRGKQLHFQF